MRHGRYARVTCRMVAAFALNAGIAAAGSAASAEMSAAPLAPRSAPRGATLFTSLPPDETGIRVENTYGDPRMWSDRYQELVYGAIGTGVAIGDFDNDGRPDLLVVSKTEGPRLFRNLGSWRFEDATERAGLSRSTGLLDQGLSWAKRLLNREPAATEDAADPWHQGATFVDVNNDGSLDLYVCRFDATNLLYINQRDGTFKEEAAARGLAIRDGSGMAAFCDYDRDGWLDVYLQTNFLHAGRSPKGQRDYLFRNTGDGRFTNVTDRAGLNLDPTAGHSATWWDYDNDGWPDLYVANDFATPDRLYRNNGDGTFTNVIDQAVPHTPYYAMGSDLGDVNNDGLIDLFVADMAATSHEKDHRGMAGSRARAQENPETFPAAPQYMRNALYLATGTSRVLEAAALAGLHATDWTWSVRLEDLDNDGLLDLHVTNGMSREYHNADLLERLMQSEDLTEPRRLMKASPPMTEANLAFRSVPGPVGQASLRFENVSAAWALDQAGVSFGAAFGDLDGDGDLDLVYTNYEHGPTVLRNDSASGHRLVVALRGTRSNRLGVGATVRVETAAGVQVRQLVLARGYLSSSEPMLHFGLGEHERVRQLVVQWPSGYTQTFTDIAANQKLTITEAESGMGVPPLDGAKRRDPPRLGADKLEPTGATPVLPESPSLPLFTEVSESMGLPLASREPPAEGTLPQPLLPFRFNRRGPSLAVGDLDHDGRDELLLGGTTLDPARIVSPGSAARAVRALTAGSATHDGPILIFEADGDGHADILITKGGANRPAESPDYQPHLLLHDGRGGFHSAPEGALPPLRISAGAAAAADFDRDGRLDVFIGGRLQPGRYPTPATSALLLNRGGRFDDVTDSVAPGLRHVGMVTSALWTDLNADGWRDLLTALDWGGVRAWVNTDRRLIDRSEELGFTSGGTGWWTSLAAADFNGDGSTDYVVGNAGLNTPYRASPEKPTLIFYGDFRGRSGAAAQLIEAYYEGDRLYPRRVRKDLGTEIPSVLRRFPRNDVYARSTLPEILGEQALATAQRFTATELRSGVFLSEPDGRYRFEPLPRLAQIAPVQGLVAGDFDGDGHADAYAVQNSWSPIPAIGRFDGGLSQLLLGNGRGEFSPVAATDSGLIVPGDAKALVSLDLNGDAWPDFVVTRNNSTTLAFQGRPTPGRNMLRVTLRGASGNPAAIGALVTLEHAHAPAQTAEVYGGSGYASQSSASVFFGYSDNTPPRRIRIRWPSGAISEHLAPFTASTLTFTEPASAR
jgi:enediyne biosynthesis protein E4